MQRTPGMYTEINTQTQRTGLPNQSHSIVLITSDAQAPATPTPIYDTATADSVSGDNSNAGRMMAAALSVSQGVRVDTVGKSEPPLPSDGGVDTPEMNFLKLRSEIIEKTQEVTAGIVYKINDGLINTAILSAAIYGRHTSLSVFNAGDNSGLLDYFVGYEPDLFDGGHDFVPMPLDQNSTYIFGVNNALFAEFAAALGFTSSDGIDGETVLTLYPASVIPSANIDYDVFDLIIDPASYTQADLQYFADRGVTPATKNPDGSYTIKSQLTLPPLEPPSGV